MESEGGRKKYAKKIFSPPREAPKRKKNQRKDSESKIPIETIDVEEAKQIEEDKNHQNNAVNYVIKLKYQLEATKQKLRAEEERFKHVIKSISAHFGSQDENFSEMLRSAHIFGVDSYEEIKADSGFEKLFTTHKYLISDKTTHEKINDNHQEAAPKPRGKKNKETPSVTKTTEIPTLSAENHIAQSEKSNTKTKKKRSMSIHDDAEEPDKKKKRKKNKAEKEDNEVKEVESTVIPHLTQENHDVDKIKQAEDAINIYQGFAHGPQAFSNKVMEDSLNYLAQQNPEQARLLHQQMQNMSNAMGINPMIPGLEMIDQNKLMDELMKMGMQEQMMRAMAPPELAYYLQMNNKK